MIDSTTEARSAVAAALITSVQASAQTKQIACVDGIVIEHSVADMGMEWWDVYATDLAGELAASHMAALATQLGPLGECVVETLTVHRPSPYFPDSNSVTYTRYCKTFTEEIAE